MHRRRHNKDGKRRHEARGEAGYLREIRMGRDSYRDKEAAEGVEEEETQLFFFFVIHKFYKRSHKTSKGYSLAQVTTARHRGRRRSGR